MLSIVSNLGNSFNGFFYEILSFLASIEQFYDLYFGAGYVVYGNYLTLTIVYLVIYLAAFAAFYVLMGIGLYKLSVRHGVSTPALSFVPFARYFQMGKLVGEVRLFGKPTKNMGFIVMMCAALDFVVGNVIDIVLYAKPCIEIIANNSFSGVAIPENVYSMFLNVLTYASRMAYFVMFAFLVIGFFRYYEKRHPFLYTILGLLLGITSVFVFVVRNHDRYDYVSEMRKFYANNRYNQSGYYGGAPRNDGYPYEAEQRSKTQESADNTDVFEEYSDNKPTQSEKKTNTYSGGEERKTDNFNGDDLF